MNRLNKLMKLLLLFVLYIYCNNLYSQNVAYVLDEIDKNNLELKSLRHKIESQKLEGREGLYLPDPEVEFNYLWGNPSLLGERGNFSVTQSFDFPLAYKYKRSVVRQNDTNLELYYKSQRIDILLKAYNLYVDIVYCNALMDIYEEYLNEAEAVALACQKKIDKDEANIFEMSKSQLSLTNIKGLMEQLDVRRAGLISEIKILNGNNNLNVTDDTFKLKLLPEDFDVWYEQVSEKNPLLQYVNGIVTMQKENVKLYKAKNLPKLSAGYMFEKTVGQHFQGVKLGLAIPVWSGKNRLNKVKADLIVAESEAELVHLDFYNQLSSLYSSAKKLHQTAVDYRKSIEMYSNVDLLGKALEAGEINIIDYFTELNFYNSIKEKALEAERNYYMIIAELESVTF